MSIEIDSEVREALAGGRPVVALESTLICHGMPQPDNLALAVEMERAVRGAGAVPATIAVLDGQVRVGLDQDLLRRLARASDVLKCATRDLPVALGTGRLGATTVSATIRIGARAGIAVMATGGLGGVHQGAEISMDVSADLDELGRTPMAVVCCGVKSILDPARTLERLETLGVPVIGFGCDELPCFYCAKSGLGVPRIDDLETLRRVIQAQRDLGLPGGVVVAQPPPAEHAMAKAEIDRLVADARRAAHEAAIRGPAETPFMLRHMAEASGGATVRLNAALAIANAGLAARLATALAPQSMRRRVTSSS
jgi:pseudouridine-5'-phosphate glycosidase